MNSLRCISSLAFLLLLLFGAGAGCQSTDSGGAPANGNVYYGAGFSDPWYYGGYYEDADVIVVPPGRYDGIGAHPEQPIARPDRGGGGSVSARPMSQPSIPSMPRGRR